jgi:hypothetical protein
MADEGVDTAGFTIGRLVHQIRGRYDPASRRSKR